MNLGILGGGQLGRMLALAGLPLGVRCRVLEPSPEASAGPVADVVRGEFDDFAALADFYRGLDVVTYEFENVPVATAHWLAERVPVYPPPQALAVSQERLAEKEFLAGLDIPTPAFAAVETRADLDAAVMRVGLPAVLKTRRFGYDGKGQAVVRSPAEVDEAWGRLGGRPLILEEFVPFDRELSLVAVRGRAGEVVAYPLVENRHEAGILRETLAPAPDISPTLQRLAEGYARSALANLEYVGVLAVEFFAVGDQLIANEIAPRVHNSGHWTIEGAMTSQFENHLRAVLGWPLGDPSARGVSFMVNLIGGWPTPAEVLAVPGAHLHLYGKSARAGRKVGHVTFVGGDPATLRQRADRILSVR